MNDLLRVVRDLTPSADADPHLLARVRADLMTRLEQDPPQTLSGPRRLRRRWVVPAVAALVATGAIGTAATTLLGDSSETTNLECPGGDYINAVIGDPVSDCTNAWKSSNDTRPPPMVAYDNGRGGITVLPDEETPPAAFTAIPRGTFQDPKIIELEETLQDTGRGLYSQCFTEEDARTKVGAELERLGLSEWSVVVDQSRRPEGEQLCAIGLPKPGRQQVELIGIPSRDLGFDAADPSSQDQFTRYAAALADELEQRCLTLEEAAEVARALAAETEFVVDGEVVEFSEDYGLGITTVEDATASCTRSSVEVGGSISVVLRGPSS